MIQRIVLNFNFIDENKALDIQNEIVYRVKAELPHRAQEIFDELEINQDTQVVIDKLEINIGTLSIENAPQHFMRRLSNQLQKSLNGISNKTTSQGTSIKNTSASEMDAYFHFLKKGYFPWWYEFSSDTTVQQLATKIQSENSIKLFSQLFAAKSTSGIIKRHFFSLATEKRLTFVEQLLQYYAQHKSEIQSNEKQTFSLSALTRASQNLKTLKNPTSSEALQQVLEIIETDSLPDIPFKSTKALLHQYLQKLGRRSIQLQVETYKTELASFPKDLLILMVLSYNLKAKFPQYATRLVVRLKQQHRLFTDKEVYHFLNNFLTQKETQTINTLIKERIEEEEENEKTINQLLQLNENDQRERLRQYFENLKRKGQQQKEVINVSLESFPVNLLILMLISYHFEGVFPQFSVRLVAKLKQQHRFVFDKEVYQYLTNFLATEKVDSVSAFIQQFLKEDSTPLPLYEDKTASSSERTSFWHKFSLSSVLKRFLNIFRSNKEEVEPNTPITEDIPTQHPTVIKNALISVWKRFANFFKSDLEEAESTPIVPSIESAILQQLEKDSEFELNKTSFHELLLQLLRSGIWPEEFHTARESQLNILIQDIEPDFFWKELQHPTTQHYFLFCIPFSFQELIANRIFSSPTDIKVFAKNLKNKLSGKISETSYQWFYAKLILEAIKQQNTQPNWKILLDTLPTNVKQNSFWKNIVSNASNLFRNEKTKQTVEAQISKNIKIQRDQWFRQDLSFLFVNIKHVLQYGLLPWQSPFDSIANIETFYWQEQQKTLPLTATYLSACLQDYKNIKLLYRIFSEKFADAIYRQVFEQQQQTDISDLIDKAVWKEKELELPDDFGDFVHRSIFMEHQHELTGALLGLIAQNANLEPKALSEKIFKTIFLEYRNDILTIISDAIDKEQSIQLTEDELAELFNSLFKQQQAEIVKLISKAFLQMPEEIDIRQKADFIYKTVFEGRKIKIDELIRQSSKENIQQIQERLNAKETHEMYQKLIEEKFDWQEGIKEGEPIHIQNAGLVILWTFLPHFFKRLGLIKTEKGKNIFVDKDAHERAVVITQHLVVGEKPIEDHQLVLNKLMCGYTVSLPVNTEIELSENELEECEALLKSIIKHWAILGDISIEALQESFLQRKGMILYDKENVNLKVEQKGIDVLIDKLPWAFNTIQFSWNDYFIFVEWNA